MANLMGLSVTPVMPYMGKQLARFMDKLRGSRSFTFFRDKQAAELIADPMLRMWLWTMHDQPCAYGHIQASENPHKRGIVRLGICVTPDLQGQGLGTRIMVLLLAECAVLGVRKINATVFADNCAMTHLFIDKFGFEPEGHYVAEEQWGGEMRDVLSLAYWPNRGRA